MSNSLGITTYEEFKQLKKEERKIALGEELASHDNSVHEVAQLWGCNDANLYDARRQLNLPKRDGEVSGAVKRSYKKHEKVTDEVSDTVKNYVEQRRQQVNQSAPVYQYPQLPVTGPILQQPLIPTMPIEPENIFAIRLSGDMKGEEITDRLMRLAEIVSKDKNYKITFDIRELKEKKNENI